jgi:hypothetical protein
VGLAAVEMSLAAACGLASSGEGAVGRPDASDPDGSNMIVAACGTACSGDDGSVRESGSSIGSPLAPDDASGDAAGGDAVAVDPAVVDAASDAVMAERDPDAADCNACIAQLCGGPCAEGSVCQLYLTCIVLCAVSDGSSCTDDCNAAYPTGPLVAACELACGIQCAATAGGAVPDAATATD